MDASYRVDILVEDRIILELKLEKNISPIDKAQLLTYLRLSGCKVGLLFNFHVAVLREGIIRMAL